MPADETCGNCKFYADSECRIRAPVVVPVGTGASNMTWTIQAVTKWPEVPATKHCWEWTKK